MAVPDEILDELYGAPLDEFTARRNALAKSLRDEDEQEAAKQVSGLKKPALPAWTINQVARRAPDAVEELIEVNRSLAEVEGAGELQELSRRRRRVVSGLTDTSRSVLQEAGHPASAQTMERISSTLLAANTPEEHDLLRRGRLERESRGGGFEGIFGELPVEEDEPRAPRKKDVERAESLQEEARAAIQEAARLRSQADRLHREVEDAERAAQSAARRAEKAQAKAEDARSRL